MTMYSCDTCDFTTLKKTDYTRHIERKIPCGNVPTNKELAEMILGVSKMKCRLKSFGDIVDDILNIILPPVKNTEDTQKNGKVLESKVSKILEEYNFSKIVQTTAINKINNFHHMRDGLYYINQPFGNQHSPDFILVHVRNGYSKTLWLECKTGKNTIFWNDGFPMDTVVYMFSCYKNNITRMFTAKDLTNDNVINAKKIYDIKKNKLNKMLRLQLENENWNPTVRGGWSQRKINTCVSSILEVRDQFKTLLDDNFPDYKRGISLFSGAGGDTIGMEMSDVKVVGFVEKDKIATETHKHNFPNSILIGQDITKITDDIFNQYSGKIDYLFGGFPCQSFSHGGKKDINDPRGQLYIDFVRATACIQPKWVIGENVKGILKRCSEDGECMADVVVKAFAGIGYYMKYIELSTVDFGVPQDRSRVIFVGCKHPININIPKTNNQTSCLRDILEYSLEDAIPITEKHTFLANILDNKFIHGGNADDKVTGKPPTNLIKCSEQKTEDDNITYGKRGKSTYSCVVDIDDVSRTLQCSYSRMPRLFVPIISGNGSKYMRPYTIMECQRIQGFPDNIEFKGSKIDIITQIGNAVPPIMISSVVSYLNSIPECPIKLYNYVADEEILEELADCEDDLTYDVDTKLLSYNNTITTVWDCEHPTLMGEEKFKWGICFKVQTDEYKEWLCNNGN